MFLLTLIYTRVCCIYRATSCLNVQGKRRLRPPAAIRNTVGEAESSGSCESGVSELGEPVDINDVNIDAEPHLFSVCDRAVKDEGDGILCEGDCTRWFHPKCARLIPMCVFHGVKKWPTYHVAVPTGNALDLQRSIFRENRLKFRPLSAAEKVSIICDTNNHMKSEMLSNTHTHRPKAVIPKPP